MNDHEAQRIAAAMHELRPDWPARSILTLIRKHFADKPRRDVTVALAWVACESASATPGRVLESGPWWKAAAGDDHGSPRHPFVRAETCGICSLPRHACELRWAHDHPFESLAHPDRRTVTAERVRELRQVIAARREDPDGAA